MIYLLRYDRSCKIIGCAAYTILLVGLTPASGDAKPIGQHVRRANTAGVKPQVWVPIVAVVIVLVALAMMFWSRRSLQRALVSMGETAAVATGSTHHDGASTGSGPATREVTAEQLVGRGSGATQNRRPPRRTRRTPSQISTASLPLYMKEPGDQELVIYRGQDPEDNPDIAVVMPRVEEDGEGHSRDASRISLYGNLPDSPQNMSLMQGDETLDPANDRSGQHLLPPNSGNSPLRASFETGDTMPHSDESSSSLLGAVQNVGDDPRGEAPPYFEVVDSDNNGGPRQGMGSPAAERTSESSPPPSATIVSRPSTDSQTQENRTNRRLSGFRSLLNTLTNTSTRPPVRTPPQEPSQNLSRHTRADSGMSVTSASTQDSRMPQNRERVASRASHRPSNSGSGSAMHMAFRTISRQKSQNTLNSAHLNSPSMISLNSISAPLSHTLTRTEISYPASGPTAEQMRLISSRESFARFAVPYGPDAIAFAASTSRHDLEPTPDYESQAPTPGTAIVARSSPLAPVLASPVDAPQLSSDSSSSQSLQETPGDNNGTTLDVNTNSEEPLASPVKEPLSPVIITEPPAKPAQAPPATQAVGQDSTMPAIPPITSSTPPPSSFKLPSSVPLMRSESRASSMVSATSFTTAEESIHDSAPPAADSSDSLSTPQGESSHPRQNIDTTVSQGIVPTIVQTTAA